ncbi:Hypp7600 [Branchiostoma lanceolatum]|uniref:Hypp7600 protein n=1 Tax=Branchiostoma lanceolatum TaxID=7740 RepID=A0A8K0EEU3_BRALA|nr:Hypp7600 [Branchiostoma lanceolatum]
MNEQGKASDSQRKHELEIGALRLRGVGQQVGNGQLGVRVLRCGDGKGVMDIRKSGGRCSATQLTKFRRGYARQDADDSGYGGFMELEGGFHGTCYHRYES